MRGGKRKTKRRKRRKNKRTKRLKRRKNKRTKRGAGGALSVFLHKRSPESAHRPCHSSGANFGHDQRHCYHIPAAFVADGAMIKCVGLLG